MEITSATTTRRTCGRNSTTPDTCDSVAFPVTGEAYNQVCGRIVAYQWGLPSAFQSFYSSTSTFNLNNAYVAGISITRSDTSREHVWTFAAGALQQVGNTNLESAEHCPCLDDNFIGTNGELPTFVGGDYFCESALPDFGSNNPAAVSSTFELHISDPLWDDQSCDATRDCCDGPYFIKTFLTATTDTLEVRLCFHKNNTLSNIGIEMIELYVK